MASYTIELKDVVSHHNIFDFRYDFYDENARPKFEEDFIRHFYFREIGCPTIDRFKVYLEDKMKTVFPYYNELFKAAKIEYSVLDNYNITENFSRTVENDQKGAGFSSNVGQLFDTHDVVTDESNKTVSDETRFENGETKTTHNTDRTMGEKTNNTTNENGSQSNSISRSGEENGTTSKNSETSVTNSGSENGVKNITGDATSITNKKFLDTPQGLLDLENAKYLTTLNRDNSIDSHHTQENNDVTTSGTSTTTNEEGGTSKVTNTGTENSEGEHETETTSNGTRDVEENVNGTQTTTTTNNSEGNTTSTNEGKTTSNYEGEQRTTNDQNTRTEMKGEQKESYQLTKRGNIGVDTDADMIQKHINLQRVLRSIEKMFFDECEDLFMMVY